MNVITCQKTAQITTKLSDYEYDLPKELIAQQPLKNRDDAQLLVLHRDTGRIEHRKFQEIVDYLSPDDLLVLNDTKVILARLIGKKISGASVELLLTEELEKNLWKALVKSNAKLNNGDELYFSNNTVSAILLERFADGSWSVEFNTKNNIKEILAQIGQIPLPPYIKRSRNEDALFSSDRERYQTVFAKKEGAIAAPTAGLHFTDNILEKTRKRGVEIEFVTLHVGLGTFLPVKTEDIRDHIMHKEYYECPKEIVQKVKKAKEQKGRVIATGSTSCRVLETIAMNESDPQFSGWTDLFIYPPYDFRYVDVLITNFHLPKTTLLMLVSAFAGRENIMNAYEIAKDKGYRFFSYGDCMMII